MKVWRAVIALAREKIDTQGNSNGKGVIIVRCKGSTGDFDTIYRSYI